MPPLLPAPFRPSTRPALVAAGWVALGIGLAMGVPTLGFPVWAMVLAVALILAVLPGRLWRKRIVAPRGVTWAAATGLAALALGGARMAAWTTPSADDVTWAGRAMERAEAGALVPEDMPTGLAAPLTVWGHVSAPPEQTTRGVRFVLAADSAQRGARRGVLGGQIQVGLNAPRYGDEPRPVYPRLEAGDRVVVTAPLRPLPRPGNPADFDYGGYLQRHGIGATMALYRADAVRVLGSDAGPLDRLATAARARTHRVLARSVPDEETRDVLTALVVAERGGVDRTTRDAFIATGLMHLLAVSGLHLVLVGLVLWRLLKPLLGRLGWRWHRVEVVRAAVTLAVLGAYVLATGASPSAVRALVMAGLLVSAAPLERPSDALNGLGVAALVLLLWNPATLLDVGFQLSFAAVGALVVLAPVLTAPIPEAWRARAPLRWLIGVLVPSSAATLGTAPVLLFHFGQVPLAGLFLNALGIPLSTIALGAGLGAVLCPIPFASDAFGAVAGVCTGWMLDVTEWGALHGGWSVVRGFVRDPWLLGALVTGLLALAAWHRPRARNKLALLALGGTALSVWTGATRGDYRPRLDAVFLDVGQGDAALLTLPNGRTLLVDAGLRDPYTDEGTWTILPHLRRMGIRRLDALVATHPHADHVGGLASVLRDVPAGRLLHNGQPAHDDRGGTHPWTDALAVADSLGLPHRALVAGDTLALDPSVRIHVLAPSATPDPTEDPNEASLVLLVEYGATRFLLTGDAEAGAETALVARYGPLLAADVVKVGHHGSRTSSTEAFVAAATRGGRTRWAVVPVARRNRHRLPDAEPLDRWRAAGAVLALTGHGGAVWLRSDGRDVSRVDWQ